MEFKTIHLKKGKETSLMRKHPWVFSGAIAALPKNLTDGALVEVLAYDKRFLGIGHYQGGGSISVRMISFVPRAIDQDFWSEKIEDAKTYRKKLGLPSADTNAFRLFHGEGDGIPGLVIDIYNHIGVIQCHSAGTHVASKDIAAALQLQFPELDTIYIRCKETLPEPNAETAEDYFFLGSKEEATITENKVPFKVNVVTGQKTGFFLDQRDNRLALAHLSEGKTILNCFCYTGGFSLYALHYGAARVDSVDVSQKAIDLLETNLSLLSYRGVHQSYCTHVKDFLQDDTVKKYDIVVVDPPAFAKSLHKRHNAVQAYKRLNMLALKKVKSGGFLFTFSCSQVVGSQLFHDTMVSAGIEAGKKIRVVKMLSQGSDHVINLFHPEGHYLKGLILYVED